MICTLISMAAFGQGQIYFASTIGGPRDNIITLSNGGTPADAPYYPDSRIDDKNWRRFLAVG